MRAGKLRERIAIERRSKSENDYGENKKQWLTVAETWGSVEPISGREFFSALQVQSDVTTRITCRYESALATVTPRDRIRHGSVIYDIKSVIDVDMRHRELQFMCTRHVDG